LAVFDGEEGNQTGQAGGQQTDRESGGEAQVPAFDGAGGEQGQRRGPQQLTGQVQCAGGRFGPFPYGPDGEKGDQHGDGQVDHEHRPPAEGRDHPPAETGPTTSALPAAPAQIPTAWARWRGSVNVWVKIANVAGSSIAAPTPCNTRNAISHPGPGATAHNPEPTAKTASPVR